jgi:hypothetical protein
MILLCQRRRRWSSTILALVALLVALALAVAPAQGQEYQPDPAWGGPGGSSATHAPGGPGCPPSDPNFPDCLTPPVPIPVDGGLALLAAAGAAYAVRRLRRPGAPSVEPPSGGGGLPMA